MIKCGFEISSLKRGVKDDERPKPFPKSINGILHHNRIMLVIHLALSDIYRAIQSVG